MKRRIRETRELSCDEAVAARLVEPKVYASALVELAGSALDTGRTTTMTSGINDAAILEKRIMRILTKSNTTAARRNFLLISAASSFIAVLVAAASFTIRPAFAQQTSPADLVPAAKRQAETEALRQQKQKASDEKQAMERRSSQPPVSEDQLAKQKVEREMLSKSPEDLAKLIKITMAEALDRATKQQPGTYWKAN